MIVSSKRFLVASFVQLLAFLCSSSNNVFYNNNKDAAAFVVVVDAAASFSTTVECHPNDPTVCVGQMEHTTPNPVSFCDETTGACETIRYEGGYSYGYAFVEGVEEGTELYDLNETDREEIWAGLELTVRIEDASRECSIVVNGNETCASCETCGSAVEGTDFVNVDVAFDCTNVPNGRASVRNSTREWMKGMTECESLLPVFYPFEFPYSSSSTLLPSLVPTAATDPPPTVLRTPFPSPDPATAPPVPDPVAPAPESAPTPSSSSSSSSEKPKTCSSYAACPASGGDCCPTPDGVFLACCDGIEISPTTVPLLRPENAACSLYPACVEAGLTAELGGEADCCPDDDGEYLACCYGVPNEEEEKEEEGKCSSDADCNNDGDYCASNGACLRSGNCSSGADCENPGNVFAVPACLGTLQCTNEIPGVSPGVCVKACDNDNEEVEMPKMCSSHEACSGLEGDCCPTPEGVFLACCIGIEVSPTTVPLRRPENAACSLYPACVESGLTAVAGGEAYCCPDDDGDYLVCCDGIPNNEEEGDKKQSASSSVVKPVAIPIEEGAPQARFLKASASAADVPRETSTFSSGGGGPGNRYPIEAGRISVLFVVATTVTASFVRVF